MLLRQDHQLADRLAAEQGVQRLGRARQRIARRDQGVQRALVQPREQLAGVGGIGGRFAADKLAPEHPDQRAALQEAGLMPKGRDDDWTHDLTLAQWTARLATVPLTVLDDVTNG